MRPIYEIAEEIQKDWKKINYSAIPYLQSMHDLENVKDRVGYDNAKGIIIYFLSNSSSWRGEIAKRIKAELKSMIK